MAEKNFYTVKESAQGSYMEKGSKFLSFIVSVHTQNDVLRELEALKAHYRDASHVCYAYRLGINGEQTRAFDDREPANSAGAPILSRIRSNDLTNVLVMVVRYFGGSKLGISGLIQAYRSAASDAIDACRLVPCERIASVTLTFDYAHTAPVNRLLHTFGGRVADRKYTHVCEVEWCVGHDKLGKIKTELDELPGVLYRIS